MASTKRKRNYSGADTPVGDDKRPRHYKPDVLLLRFEYTDLPNLNEEIDNLCKIFKAKKCDVTLAVIPMKDPWAFIRPQVLKFLRVYHQSQTRNKIIVISGHGGWSAGTELCFCIRYRHSHNVPDRVSQLRSDVRTLLELHDSMQKQMVLTNIDEDKLKSM
ncbi:hypothetical protein QBC40DRAFT_258399 [Triangularia verruculosa]|uniref:Uncharacterized protein n=1 Tax=Triangularia verruculosa TaxID=2587418 RepID=A0AAN6XAI2_9PEZI|nr:hypothetical protein QBC40DRAFT_258399 [Triangularia verruculosa]